jgi:hypothetical protein
MSRLQHFAKYRLTDCGEVVSLTCRLAALYPEENAWYSFLLEAESTPKTIERLEGLGPLKVQ